MARFFLISGEFYLLENVFRSYKQISMEQVKFVFDALFTFVPWCIIQRFYRFICARLTKYIWHYSITCFIPYIVLIQQFSLHTRTGDNTFHLCLCLCRRVCSTLLYNKTLHLAFIQIAVRLHVCVCGYFDF